MSRVVVIGAGMGGLAAGARLASQGHDVTVLERSGDIGGKLGLYEREGYRFDTGPSLLTIPQVFEEFFADTGSSLTEAVGPIRLETACEYRFADGTQLSVPGTLEQIPTALDHALGAGSGQQWLRFIEAAADVWQVAEDPFLRSPITLAQILRIGFSRRSLASLAPWRSHRSFAGQFLVDPRLQQLADRYATYTGSDPRRAPSPLVTIPYAEQTFGSWYVPGGLHRLATAVHERLLAHGGQLHTGVEVHSILERQGHAAGVMTADGEKIAADVVVANNDASAVYGSLLQNRVAHRELRRLRRATPSLSGFVLLLALEDLPDQLLSTASHHRILFPEDYDAEFNAIFGSPGRRDRHWTAQPVVDPTIYITAPQDRSIVPDPRAGAWFVLVNAPRHQPSADPVDGGLDWTKPGMAENYAAAIVDLMAERGLDIRGHLRWMEYRSPADLERLTGAPGGSIYGTSSNGASAAFRRPRNVSPFPGLYLVGGSAHPGGGLPLVALSAAIVAQAVGPA